MNQAHALIMIVDDIPENLQVLGNILHKEGFDTSFAQNGIQALEIIAKILPDLILLDISMPEMDGFEVCEKLKQNELTQHIPVIFLTARSEDENMIHGFSLGAADYVTKPFSTQELLARVNAHLRIKLSNDIINQQNEELKQLNNTKDKFFSIIAHDLKNPFAVLLSSAELLLLFLENNNLEKAKEKANMILNSSKKGHNLLQNLLDWAISQLGNLKMNLESIALKAIIDKTISVVENQAISKEIKLVNEINENILVLADDIIIQVVVRNLITNSIKYTPNLGTINIRADIIDNFAHISVLDSGIGMEQQTLDNLFRIDKKNTTKGTNGETGTGLGLILCKEYIEKHGGKIWVNSTPGEGSEFVFTLPVC